MPATQHRCLSSGETVELEARFDPDAQWYVTYHRDCSSVCTNYHEKGEL